MWLTALKGATLVKQTCTTDLQMAVRRDKAIRSSILLTLRQFFRNHTAISQSIS